MWTIWNASLILSEKKKKKEEGKKSYAAVVISILRLKEHFKAKLHLQLCLLGKKFTNISLLKKQYFFKKKTVFVSKNHTVYTEISVRKIKLK